MSGEFQKACVATWLNKRQSEQVIWGRKTVAGELVREEIFAGQCGDVLSN